MMSRPDLPHIPERIFKWVNIRTETPVENERDVKKHGGMKGRSKGVGVLTYCTLAAGSGVIRLGKHVQLKVQRSTSTIIILTCIFLPTILLG